MAEVCFSAQRPRTGRTGSIDIADHRPECIAGAVIGPKASVKVHSWFQTAGLQEQILKGLAHALSYSADNKDHVSTYLMVWS
jgi:hypothetical protein